MRFLPRPFIPYIGYSPTYVINQVMKRIYRPRIEEELFQPPLLMRMLAERQQRHTPRGE